MIPPVFHVSRQTNDNDKWKMKNDKFRDPLAPQFVIFHFIER